jgi:flagellar biosynthesis/type III secretory pathway M-ring protein FliF/YscJ
MTSTNVVTETYEPSAKVPTKEEIKTKSEVEESGLPGEGQPAAPGSTMKDETIVTEYAVSKTVEQNVDLPGEIKSLTVAAFVDLSPPDANEAESGGQSAMIMELSDVEGIIRNALGLKETDSLKVVPARFHRPVETLGEEEEPSNWPRYVAIARQVSLGIMAICALLVLRVFSGAKRKVTSAVEAGQLPESEGAVGLLPGGTESSDSLVLRRRIADALQSNPEQVRQLFASWLEERGA